MTLPPPLSLKDQRRAMGICLQCHRSIAAPQHTLCEPCLECRRTSTMERQQKRAQRYRAQWLRTQWGLTTLDEEPTP